MKVIKEEIEIFQDQRGFVFNPLNKEDITVQKNVHLVITLPGFIRGNHFHKKGIENLIIYGSALIRIKEQGEIIDIIVAENEAIRLTIPPGISHAIKNIGSNPNLLVAFNTIEHTEQDTDVYPDILIDNSDKCK